MFLTAFPANFWFPNNFRLQRLPATLILVVLVLVGASCGGDDDVAGTGGDDATEVTADAPDTDTGTADGADADPDAGETDAAANPDSALGTKPVVDEKWLGSFDELIVTDIVEGDGETAQVGSMLSMQYVGVLASDGTQFDASWDRGQPFEFQLGQGRVIAGWDEGIVGMTVGSRRVLQIPAIQAYGERDSGSIPANSDLVFIVDLIAVQPPPPTPEPAPPVPEDALGAIDELSTIDLVEGSGPAAERGDILVVQYVGVDATNGIEFDSSWSRGQPFRVTAGMSQVIDGWNEGLIGMKEGGERILRIPAAKAYGDEDLVFRVHLDELIEAPIAHLVTFDDPIPTDVTTEVLVDGSGDGAEKGSEIDVHIALFIYSRGELIQSTWEQGSTEGFILLDEALMPGFADALVGLKVGETRRIDLPADVAFPDGVPADGGFEEDDAVVFVVERMG